MFTTISKLRIAIVLSVVLVCVSLVPPRAWSAGKEAGALPSTPAAAAEDDNDDDDDDDDDEDEAQAKPLAYLDLTTFYASASGPAFLLGGPRVTSLTLTAGSSQSALVDAPLTVDFNDRFSAYVAVSGSSFASGPAPWTSFRADSWRTGFVADVVEQTAWLPTVTVSGFVSRPFDHSSLAFQSTTYSAALDLDRTLDAEETRGLIAGGSLTRITVDTGPVRIGSIFMIYGGAYRKFDDWKLSARAGFQRFEGARAGSIAQVEPVNMPFVRADLERLDDDDNRLFGLAFALGWSPKLSVVVALSTPIFFNK